MKHRIALTIALLALAALGLGQESGGPMRISSAFAGTPGKGLIFSRTAMSRGDILTVVVKETSTGNFTQSTSTTKKDSNVVDATKLPLVDVFTGPVLGQILGKAASLPSKLVHGLLGGGSSGANSSVSGSGTTSTAGDFSATISVIVKEVLPNGNLVIEGQRYVKVNKEMQSVVLSGVVRTDDIAEDNTIPSSKIAQARIYAEGKGAIADRQRRGLLTRVLEWIF